jgi:hypothetical protein
MFKKLSERSAIKKPLLSNYLWIVLLTGLLLAGCSTVTPDVPVADTLDAELETTAVASLRGKPNFSEGQLPTNVRLWYKRLWVGIKRQGNYSSKMASTGNLEQLGRHLNFRITSQLTAFRATGDLRLLDEIDRVMQVARGQLKDYNRDGYVNWRQLNKNGNKKYYNNDYHNMNEMLTHGMVAAVAYAFHINRDLDSRYAERAKFWTNYLEKHFEAKWRKRNKVSSSSYNFLTWNYIHPYTQFIRYHYYMHKLTGKQGYLNEALKMASEVDKRMAQSGSAFVWAQSMNSNNKLGTVCQPRRYAQITMQAAEDLALEGFAQFGKEATMRKYAATLSQFIMNDSAKSFATDVCGDKNRAGLKSAPIVGYAGRPGGRATPTQYAATPFTALGRWDTTGKVVNIAGQVYRSTESNLDNPQRMFIPAAMVSILSK